MTTTTNAKTTTTTRKPRKKRKAPSPVPSLSNSVENGQKCRTILDEINTLTYLIDNDEMVMNDLYTHLEDIKTYLAFAIQQKGHSRENELSNNETDIAQQDVVASKNDNTFFITTTTDDVKTSNISDSNHLVIESNKNQVVENITNVEVKIGDNWTLSTPSNDSSENENRVIKVGEYRQTSETVEASVNDNNVASVTVIANDDTEESSLNPQETQALTNMIRVLLEENKSGNTSSSLPT